MTDDDILGKAYDARLMRRLLEYLRPYRGYAALALAAIICASMLQLAQPYLMKLAIDRYIANGDLPGINRIALLYLLIVLASFCLEFTQTWLLQMTGQRIMFDMRTRIYEHLQRLDLRFYDRNPVGRLMTRVTTDVDVINDLFTSGVVSVFGDVFTLVGIMIVLLSMNWRLALVTFAVLPLIVLVTQWFRRHVRESYRTVRMLIARINAYLQEHITGMSTVQLFRREARAFGRFGEINEEHRRANVESIFYYAVFYPAIELVGGLAAALTIWFGGGWVLRGGLTLGSLVAFLLYSQRFFRPISDMSEKFNILQAAMASSERIFKLLDEPVVVRSPPAAAIKAPAVRAGHIVFDRVWFAYGASSTGEDGLRPARRLVRGPPRRARRHRRRDGRRQIHLDQSAAPVLRRLSRRDQRRRCGRPRDVAAGPARPVQPRPAGRASVQRNDCGKHPAGEPGDHRRGCAQRCRGRPRRARSSSACRGGYGSPVAERGATLSVGQKQLLSFARALAFDPRILVLDEATSSVDTETEILIRDALHVLMAGRTTIAIAHRLSTIQDMDKILVLHKGHLRESGTHQELLARRGHLFQALSAAVQGSGIAGRSVPGLSSFVLSPWRLVKLDRPRWERRGSRGVLR